ncbi:sensor histidine kinase [Paenibacillus albicereus]|uniref:histidine kinase n=1 Tax=Paenibacillus albicereus TaxID=2726185 RepID=A0A6H2H0F0_9BACL|nr:histidine kinase [Paenibacillus albicereus]QJC53135.1 sensor histidine kinase [Paenibacillus albicereus]
MAKPRLPFHAKLLLTYVLLVLASAAAVGGYAYVTSSRAAESSARANLDVAMDQMRSNIEYRLEEIDRAARQLEGDQPLSRYLSGYYLDWERHQAMTEQVLPRLEAAASLPRAAIRLTLYLERPAAIGERYEAETGQALSQGVRSFEIRHAPEAGWYRELALQPGLPVWRQVGQDERYGYISLLRPIVNYETFRPIGAVRVAVKLQDIFEDAEPGRMGGDSRVYVRSLSGEPLYPEATQAEQAAEAAGGRLPTEGAAAAPGQLRLEKKLGPMPATLVALVPLETFQRHSAEVRNLTIAVCLGSVLLMSAISIVPARAFSRRVTKLTHSLRAFRDGDYGRRLRYRGRDEFADIAASFNEMASTTQRLIDEVYVSDLAKKEAELQLLHSQINPHFLSNTFSSISRMAKLGAIDKLHEMIRELASFYRMSLNKGELTVRLAKELQIAESYLSIQNIKHGGRIRYRIDCPEELRDCETVKFVLQPFVENVLEHAWAEEEIGIAVSARRQEERLVLEVTDDGIGMTAERAAAVLGGGPDGPGYGIRNVDARIKLHYGDGFGASIRSAPGEGTTVRLELPLRAAPGAGQVPQ